MVGDRQEWRKPVKQTCPGWVHYDQLGRAMHRHEIQSSSGDSSRVCSLATVGDLDLWPIQADFLFQRRLAVSGFRNKTVDYRSTDLRHIEKLLRHVLEEFPVRMQSPQNL